MIKLFINEVEYALKTWTFPGGELGVRLNEFDELVDQNQHAESLTANVVMLFQSNDDLIALGQVAEILDQLAIQANPQHYQKHLSMPYVPYSPQDRACASGESASLKILAAMVNAMGFDRVVVVDPHSFVVENLIKNVSVLRQDLAAKETLDELIVSYDYIIAPDAGAEKKALAFKKRHAPHATLVTCSKQRNEQGDVVGYSVPEGILIGDGVKALVIDDICWGGATFLNLAKELEKANDGGLSLHLYVTHGFFSKGVNELRKHFDSIHTYLLFNTDPEVSECVNYTNLVE